MTTSIIENLAEKTFTVTATSKHHGAVTVELCLKQLPKLGEGNKYEMILLTDGFSFGGQTSGMYSNGVPLARNPIERKLINFFSKKSLTRLGSQHIFIYKDGDIETKGNRFILSFWGIDLTKNI